MVIVIISNGNGNGITLLLSNGITHCNLFYLIHVSISFFNGINSVTFLFPIVNIGLKIVFFVLVIS